jgi:hypothetical protein
MRAVFVGMTVKLVAGVLSITPERCPHPRNAHVGT